MTRIVAIGECMVEMAPTGDDGTFRMGFAGDTMNTAWYLRRLLGPDDQVDYLTAVGVDEVSGRMVAFLADAKLGTDHILRRPDLTVGLYLIQLSAGERSFSYWRSTAAARTLAQDGAALTRALHGADVAYFSGITMAILPPEDRATLLDALAAFRADGGQVVFDPNLRPRLWTSTDDMTATIMKAAAVSTIALPSYEDEADHFGDTGIEATARRYLQAGAQTVTVKNGPGRVLTISDGIPQHFQPAPVHDIVDTTAAGDSFNAGYLAALLQGAPSEGAVAAGADLAARVIQARGALVDV